MESVSLSKDTYKDNPTVALGGLGCPSITLDCPEALTIPENFRITFCGHRGQIVARSSTRHEKASASVTLHLTKLCDVEEVEPDEVPEEQEKNPIDSLFERAKEDEPEEE